MDAITFDRRRRENHVDYAMTLREVADKLGMNKDTVATIERRALAKIQRELEWVAAAYGMSVRDLLKGRAG